MPLGPGPHLGQRPKHRVRAAQRCWPGRATGRRPAPGHASPRGRLSQQVLYQKSMKALDLLLQTFIAENKSMEEVCFLLQVKDPGLPGPSQAWSQTVQSPPRAGGRLTPRTDPSTRGPLSSGRGGAGCLRSVQGPGWPTDLTLRCPWGQEQSQECTAWGCSLSHVLASLGPPAPTTVAAPRGPLRQAQSSHGPGLSRAFWTLLCGPLGAGK